MRRAATALMGLFLILLGATGVAAEPVVSAVRVGEHPDKTRFVMEISAEPRYRVFSLPDPFRVVIDLPEVRWEPGSKSVTGGDGLIAAMRFGLFAPGTTRIVLDMRKPARVRDVFVIPPSDGFPHRLVIDMAAVGRAAFFRDRRTSPFESRVPLAPPATAPMAEPKVSKTDNRPTIVIDPGHGGVDPGARSLTGADEKDIALAYAHELRRRLLATGRYRVVMTREKDVFVRLRDRVAFAQRMGGDLFVSIHANNHRSRRIRGASVYTLSEKASDAEAEALATKENKADIIAGLDFSDQSEEVNKILIDLAQRETMNRSKLFANMLVKKLGSVTRLLRNTHRFAGFAVLKSPVVASVLVEIGYLSNAKEERLLRNASHRAKVANATIQAIDDFFKRQSALNRS